MAAEVKKNIPRICKDGTKSPKLSATAPVNKNIDLNRSKTIIVKIISNTNTDH